MLPQSISVVRKGKGEGKCWRGKGGNCIGKTKGEKKVVSNGHRERFPVVIVLTRGEDNRFIGREGGQKGGIGPVSEPRGGNVEK